MEVTATDADSSTPLPARVQVIPVDGAFQPPDNFGEPSSKRWIDAREVWQYDDLIFEDGASMLFAIAFDGDQVLDVDGAVPVEIEPVIGLSEASSNTLFNASLFNAP